MTKLQFFFKKYQHRIAVFILVLLGFSSTFIKHTGLVNCQPHPKICKECARNFNLGMKVKENLKL